jgi:hypothetical protein
VIVDCYAFGNILQGFHTQINKVVYKLLAIVERQLFLLWWIWFDWANGPDWRLFGWIDREKMRPIDRPGKIVPGIARWIFLFFGTVRTPE